MKRKFKKGFLSKILIPVLVAACSFGTSMGVAYAYYVDSAKLQNSMTAGYPDIKTVEEFTNHSLTVGENLFTKKVSFQNVGNVPIYVRAYVEFSDYDIEKKSQLSGDGTTYYSVSDYVNHLPSGWTYNATDGYFYYTKPVAVGQMTPALFTNVKTTFASQKEVAKYKIYVGGFCTDTKTVLNADADYTAIWAEVDK